MELAVREQAFNTSTRKAKVGRMARATVSPPPSPNPKEVWGDALQNKTKQMGTQKFKTDKATPFLPAGLHLKTTTYPILTYAAKAQFGVGSGHVLMC